MKLILLPVILLFINSDVSAKNLTLIDDAEPVITTQPLSQLECEGNLVKFKVIASGSGLTYTWQRKRLVDVNFVTIVDEPNNSEDSSTNEIRILSTGSAQYPDGTQFQVIVSDGSSSVISSAATLTVNEIKDLTGGANVAQCFGTNYSYTVTTSYPEDVVSYRWRKSVASGVWDEITDGAIYSGTTTATLNIAGGTPAESGRYRVYITFTSSGSDCNVTSTSRPRQITFLPLLTTPETTIIQPTCVLNTRTIKVAVQSATDVYSFDNGLNFQNGNEKSGLAAGSYNVIIKNAAGCVSPTMICPIIEVGQASIWDGTTWLNGDPELTRSVVFEQDFSSIADIEGCSCQVTNGANVIINGAHTLKITNAVNVVDGTLTFENNASLVQVNDDAVNSGSIIYKRNTTPVNRYDYTYWSSPVAGFTLKKLSPFTLFDRYFIYNDGWEVSLSGVDVMKAGHGYIVRAPQTYPISGSPSPYPARFEGIPNNGVVTLALLANKDYLLGNPYPSAINADQFLQDNLTALQGTLYFWTHNSPPVTASGTTTYKYVASDYASYNRTGGTKAAVNGGDAPLGKIAAGQGFFAPSSTTGGTVIFNNTMRISGGISGTYNSQFFKWSTGAKTTTASTEKSRLWLNLTNNEGAFKQTLIGYVAGATNEYDNGFDGLTYNGNQFVDFYSISEGINLAIQGRALPFLQKDSIAVGYKSTIKGDFQISIDHADGILSSQEVFLEDKGMKLMHNLKNSPYVFSTETGVFNDRFVLHYVDKNRVERIITEEPLAVDDKLIVSVQNNEITVNSLTDLITKIIVYDILGQSVYQKEEIAASSFTVQNLNLVHQVLLVQLTLANGETVSTKIVY